MSERAGVLSLLAVLAIAAMPAVSRAASEGCGPAEPADAPHARITNGTVDAIVMLPDRDKGFYRGTRFDWAGVVSCLKYKGHGFFGLWAANATPGTRDHVSGPVEEFRAADSISSPGYDDAKPGEAFVKPGVGVLRRVDTTPYSFNFQYPVIDPGKWTVKPSKDRVWFRHELSSPIGIAYRYDKTLRLDAKEPILIVEHEMKNTGSKVIDLQTYYHDFFVFDDTPTGPDISIRFPFKPEALRTLRNGARIDGQAIVFDREFAPGDTSTSEILGFSSEPSQFDFTIENAKTGAGVQQTGSLPLTRVVFWANSRTACPEGYVHVLVLPGRTVRWSVRYRFFVKT
ncbi:MAG: hypothetical protein RL603_1886 [Pseudomonadota bacterium]|jgi:hypothetical protein